MAIELSMRARSELARAEICEASWYLYLKRGPILESPIAGHHFIVHPLLGIAWDRCKELADQGKTWELYEVLGQAHNAELYEKVTGDAWGMPVANERMMLQCFEGHELLARLRKCTSAFQDGESTVEEWLTSMKEGTEAIQNHRPDDSLIGNAAASRGLELCRGAVEHTSVPVDFLPEPWRDIPTKHVHIVGAETSSHKTTWAINAALSIARSHNPETGEELPVTYWTLEDSNDLILARMLTHISDEDIRVRDVMRGGLKDRMGPAFRANKVLAGLPLKFIDGTAPIDEVIARLYRDWAKRRTVCTIIDYIGDIDQFEGRGALGETAQLTGMIKRLDSFAKRTNQAIFVVAQFKHEYSGSADKDGQTRAPNIGDVYGGSRLCQKAFSVFLNHVVEKGVDGSSDQRMITYVRKFKSEGKGQVKLRVDPIHNRIWAEDFAGKALASVVRLVTSQTQKNRGFTREIKE